MDGRPSEWPVLVTGAGGFVGGHVARHLAQAGHRVVSLTRRPPVVEPGDPAIEWRVGDLRAASVRADAVRGVRAVVHSAGWVDLGADRSGEAKAVNVDATRDLLEEASRAGIERFVFTSTLHTIAAGTAEEPADESSPWNLRSVDAPYSRTKRQAERLVLAGTDRLAGVALCPGMVVGPRDHKPTSTRVLWMMAKLRVAYLPGGGIPIVDSGVIARAHRMALDCGEPGARYAVAGPYLSYRGMARIVAQIAGRPRFVVPIPDAMERPLTAVARWVGRGDVSPAAVAGGFLRLHVCGDRADRAFGLVHPTAQRSIADALGDPRRSGGSVAPEPRPGPTRP